MVLTWLGATYEDILYSTLSARQCRNKQSYTVRVESVKCSRRTFYSQFRNFSPLWPISLLRRPFLLLKPIVETGTNDDWLPPYSECVHSGTNKKEEPPPPYSTCFLKPEEAELLVNSRTQNILDERAQSSTVTGSENGLRAESLATSSNQSGDVAPGSKMEVVLDTSRIV